ncbi:hypothetical protein PG996_010959 [Apiospora saccharicola]|uniref:Uncharacterized protein n=1 Tax=Apiospora saccharicola TaxID=335842 RepID=A0ABR1UE94_9PEZI
MLVVVESCLSASCFADRLWKENVLRIADGLLPAASRDEITRLLQVRIQLRQTTMTRLYGSAGEPDFTIPATDERTNGYFASEVTLRVQTCLEFGLLASARSMLSRYNPGRFGRLSAFEAAQKQEIALLEGIIYRLEGQFSAAIPLLISCMRHHWLETRCVVHLAAVECELGQSSSAIDRLDAFISTAVSNRRPRLALANAHLTRLLTALRDKKPYMHLVPATKRLFTALDETGGRQTGNRTLMLDRVNIAIALAMLEHIAGNLDSASAAWQRALGDSKRHHASPGYTDMVISYSSYELETRRGDPAEASLLEAKARLLFASTGRQYYMTSLGTIWPDIVGDWLEASGRERVIR